MHPQLKALGLGLLLVALIAVGYWLTTQATKRDRQIVIKDPQSGEEVISLLLPAGWVSDPYFPQGMGFPVMLFADRGEHRRAQESIQRGATSFYPGVRGITGVLLKKSLPNPQATVEGWLQSVPADDKKLLVVGEIFAGAQRWCGESRQGDQYYVMCYVGYQGGRAASFNLTSGGDSYEADLETFRRVIGSVRLQEN